jgi:hypothetical protein
MHDLLPRLLALLDSEDDGEREAACALLATLAEHHRPSEADRTAALEVLRSHLDEPELCGTLAALVLAGGPARRWSELALVVEEGLCGEHADSAAEIVRALLDARVAVPDDLVRRVLEHASEEYAADVLATWLDSHDVAAWVLDDLIAEPERFETLPRRVLVKWRRHAPSTIRPLHEAARDAVVRALHSLERELEELDTALAFGGQTQPSGTERQ